MDTSFHKSPNNFKSAAISSSVILTLEYRTKVPTKRFLIKKTFKLTIWIANHTRGKNSNKHFPSDFIHKPCKLAVMTDTYYLRIALPVPLRRQFDYLPVANTAASTYEVGSRVRVPFGRQQLIGFVLSIVTETEVPLSKLKPITESLDSQTLVSPHILELCEWLSSYYHHPLGEVLDLAIPVLLRKGGQITDIAEPHWRVLTSAAESGEATIALNGKKQLALWQLFQQQPQWRHKDLTQQGFAKAQLDRLSSLGLIEPYQQLPIPHCAAALSLKTEQALTLNSEQASAVDKISQQLGKFHVALLDGVTGSGKTEVYLQLIAKTIAQGQQALVLVPEIGLTPQTLRRFQARFDVPVVMMHSNLNDKERLIAWHQCNQDQAKILIGTRSAIFTPLPSLGLIIIDEEHDGSFKQQDGLRYNARDFAIKRAHKESLPIVLGSATPALETLHNAYSRRYSHHKLTIRAGNAKPPKMKLHSILHQPLEFGLALPVVDKIKQHLNAGQQVMVFINRRGFAPTLACRDCGWMAECIRCDARMTMHQYPPHMHCHHCDNQVGIPRLCPNCNSMQIEALGQGTERIEENLHKLFAGADIKRVDRDTVRTKDAFDNLFDEIHKGEPCILVGTQMLAKGHHFPDVTMVVILDADSGLFSADFRGMEKTAQLILQVAGRAGRGDKEGEVWIQTLYADHPQLNLLLEGGYHGLAANLLQERKHIQLPPYSYMALLRTECSDKQLAEQVQNQARDFVQNWLNQYWQGNLLSINESQADTTPVTLLGPFPAPMERRNGRFRQQMQIMSHERNALHRVLEPLSHYLENLKGIQKVRWNLDVDPIDMS
jgi:primosomal protein N' (replication factor Y)